MAFVRRVLAFPFYLMAMVLHLSCAGFTIVAQKIARDEAGPSRFTDVAVLLVFCCAAVSALMVYVVNKPAATANLMLLVPQTPMPGWRSIPTGFTSDQVVWVRPLIRLNACMFAERAVRHALQPAIVELAPCAEGNKNNVTIDDDYFEVAVSGFAKLNDRNHAYKVTLNHYPPSTSEWGFIATGIEIDRGDTQNSEPFR